MSGEQLDRRWVAAITLVKDGNVVPLIWTKAYTVRDALEELEQQVEYGARRRTGNWDSGLEWKYCRDESTEMEFDEEGCVIVEKEELE
jgi:hypothetical protein